MGFQKLLNQITHNSICTDSSKPNEHRTGDKTLKLGRNRPDSVDSVELGEKGFGFSKIRQQFVMIPWLNKVTSKLLAWNKRNQQVLSQKLEKESSKNNGSMRVSEGDEVENRYDFL